MTITDAAADTLTAVTDSVAVQAVDSVALTQSAPVAGIVLEAPPVPPAVAPPASTAGTSIVTGALLLIFCIVAFRFRSSARYFGSLLRDLTVVRLRQNAFDDTVRETSFLVLLNILEISCAGVLMAYGIVPAGPSLMQTAVCVGVCSLYALGMWIAYSVVGNVFSDGVHTRMWVRGYGASQGLLSLLLLPLALLCICYPADGRLYGIIGLGCFILAKMVFLWKGFRIFFTQISSWVLFLYYLCSLEIVPLLIIAATAVSLCARV